MEKKTEVQLENALQYIFFQICNLSNVTVNFSEGSEGLPLPPFSLLNEAP